jgi:hypothetical protein
MKPNTKPNNGLAQAISEMIIARDAERAAKQRLLTLMREDERFTDAAIKAALIAGGYSEKSAENMTTAYRALIEGRTPTPVHPLFGKPIHTSSTAKAKAKARK